MSTVLPIESRIRAVLASNPQASGADLSRELKVTRQRISAALKAAGITLVPHWLRQRQTPRAPAPPPQPRVITGGIPTTLSHTVVGCIAEQLVAADLLARGYRVYTPLVRNRGHDIVAETPSRKLITVEVRSGKRRATGGGFTYQRQPRDQSDFYAVVLLGEPVTYRPDLPE